MAVIAIISILASLLLPAVARSKEEGRMITCVNNLHQIAMAVKLYVDDHGFRFPPHQIYDPADGYTKNGAATLGGYDPVPVELPYYPPARLRVLYDYVRPSQVYQCPVDKGQDPQPCAANPPAPPLKPSNFQMIGCSYQYNARDLTVLKGGGFSEPVEDWSNGMALKPESWVEDPVRYILLHEPAARIYACPAGVPWWCQWHFVRGRSDIRDPIYARQQFISPIAFVDGHVKVHNFSKALSRDPYYPYEPTKDWIWYKPAPAKATVM